MRKFRNIIVDNTAYQWLFRYDDYDYCDIPYLLIIMKSAPKATLKIVFSVKDHFLLNSGLPATFHGAETQINLNCPFIISQIIQHYSHKGEFFNWKGYRKLDGTEILQQIGYIINEHFL